MCKEEGKGISFFCKFSFSLLSGQGRGSTNFIFLYVEGGWEGEGVDFF